MKRTAFTLLVLFSSSSEARVRSLTILNWNVEHLRSHSGAYAPDVVASTILDADASVVVLQEVWSFWEPPCVDQMADLRARIGARYPFSVFGPASTLRGDLFKCGTTQGRRAGTAIFSKHPFARPPTIVPLPDILNHGPRNYIEVEIVAGLEHYTVLATHFQNDTNDVIRSADRIVEADAIATRVKNIPGQVFVVGDFNALFDAFELSPLRVALVSSSQVATPALNRIDQVWFRRPAFAAWQELPDHSVSDHPPYFFFWFLSTPDVSFQRLTNTALNGSDIGSYVLAAFEPHVCESHCSDDVSCRSYTLTPDRLIPIPFGVLRLPPVCQLKNAVPAHSPAPGTQSGIRL
jgi:endonuclease/exonuclease/phosphatase family metal-dependent hydrolase